LLLSEDVHVPLLVQELSLLRQENLDRSGQSDVFVHITE